MVAAVFGLSACADSGGGLFGGKKAPVVAAAADETPAAPLVKPMKDSSIPVLVNDVPITTYDINQRMRLDKLSGGKAVTTDAATNELIDETVETIEAQRNGLNIPDAQVDAAFAGIAQHLKLTPPGLTKALSTQGIDATSLKKRIRAQMTWQALVQRRTQSKAQITSDAVKEAITQKGDASSLIVSEYTLQQIIFVVPAGSPASLYAQRRSEAQAFRLRFTGCDQSLDQAKNLRGVVVKDIGRRDSTDLTGPAGEAVQKTPVGSTAEPTQSPDGIELIAVCAKTDIHSSEAARTEVQNDLYLKQADDLGKDYLKELRDSAIIERR
ncbi:MAG: hypothetical protein WDM84_08285 [Bauldia sp.]